MKLSPEDRVVESARRAWNILEGYLDDTPEFFEKQDLPEFFSFYQKMMNHLTPPEESET